MDPLVRVGPRRRPLVDAGLLADRSAVLGPGTQRRAGAAVAGPVVAGALCGIRVVRVDTYFVPCPEPDTNVGARGLPSPLHRCVTQSTVRVALLTSVDG